MKLTYTLSRFIVILIVIFGVGISSATVNGVPRAFTYDRAKAVAWAQANNYNNGKFYGSSHGRWCTTYVARSLAQGGVPGVSTNWVGNGQIIRWMLNNPSLWEAKPLDQLIEGDFIFYTTDAEAPANWSYLYPNGASRWGHVVLVVTPGKVSSWNAEYKTIPINAYSNHPYRLGVHIRDEVVNNNQPTFKGSLTYGGTQWSIPLEGDVANPATSAHKWKLNVSSNHAPVMFDVGRESGDLTYRFVLTNEAGTVLQDSRSTSTGRGIIWVPNPGTQSLYVTLYADNGRSGVYNITGWATSIPHIKYEWTWQDSPMHIHRWHNDVGNNAQFYFVTERLAGDLEFNWRIVQRSNNQVLALGTTYNGVAIAPGTATGEVDFYIDSTIGEGSYRIGLRHGSPQPVAPVIMQPQPDTDAEIGRNFTIELSPGAGNGQGTTEFQVQIDDSDTFDSVDYDSGWITDTKLTITNEFAPGEYYLRVQQGNGQGSVSGFTDPLKLKVGENVGPGELLLNQGFETAGETDKRAEEWEQKPGSAAKRVCNSDTKQLAHSGQCAYQVRGKVNTVSKIVQKVKTAGLPDDTMTLSAWVSTKNLTAGSIIRTKVKFENGEKQSIVLDLPEGTNPYAEITESIVLTGVSTKAIVKIQINASAGKVWIDDMTLLLVSSESSRETLIPLPVSAP